MPIVAGVDGCRGGWVVARFDSDARRRADRYRTTIYPTFAEVLAALPGPIPVAVDMPIGLLAQRRVGGRPCDQAARRLLPGKASSVFSPPCREALPATTYDAARPFGVTIYAFHLLPKLREVDAAMTPRLQRRVFEAHPELAFRRLNGGRPILESKATSAGHVIRRERLIQVAAEGRWRRTLAGHLDDVLAATRRADLKPDDLADAWANAEVAWRYLHGRAECVPPPDTEAAADRDPRGLRMEIWW